MAIENVWIEEGCISCGMCVQECPEVFKMDNALAVVKEDVDFNEYEESIKRAADICPAGIIKFS
ncbi:MAG: ferredoxin [Candidatus Mcinerneyibacterium aminivorans]|uniref:Ferredoxin n=1 Tax=Candidatus Mcinerneyibacterium aminivorans TaxID=2703815 RepID=A0A5D0MIV5_9BACT|nr:MAG: ferredoxin [Candidatus Mcinerneyibacterium aminivorans]